MIRRLWTCQVALAGEARRAYGARRRTALGERVSMGEWLTIQERAEEPHRPCKRRTQVYTPVSGLPQQD